MTRKTRAILLNALLLPGLGQLYLGRKVTGIILLLIVNLLMLLAVFVLLKGAAPLIAAQAASGQINYDDIQTAVQGAAGLAKGVLTVFAIVWGFALFDVIRPGKES